MDTRFCSTPYSPDCIVSSSIALYTSCDRGRAGTSPTQEKLP